MEAPRPLPLASQHFCLIPGCRTKIGLVMIMLLLLLSLIIIIIIIITSTSTTTTSKWVARFLCFVAMFGCTVNVWQRAS